MQILLPYLHFIGIMVIMGSLISEHLMLKPGILKQQIKSLAGVDLIYWLAILVVLASGLLRWLIFDPKGVDFFSKNPLFHIKLTVFFIMAIISIFPTIKLRKWNKQARQENHLNVSDRDIKKQLMFIRVELLLLAIIPLLAVMVALGKGF
jgi:putative membrane protein